MVYFRLYSVQRLVQAMINCSAQKLASIYITATWQASRNSVINPLIDAEHDSFMELCFEEFVA